MFQRRKKLSFWEQTRQLLWPRMGILRLVKYYCARIPRLTDSTHLITTNLAAGSAMSFTPFFGIHILGAMGIAKIVCGKINIIAALVGTLFGNPWTFPILLYSSYSVGVFIINLFSRHNSTVGFDSSTVESQGENLISFFWENFANIFIPTALGGCILTIITFPIFYILYYYVVLSAQKARKIRLKHKQKALFNKKAHGDDHP